MKARGERQKGGKQNLVPGAKDSGSRRATPSEPKLSDLGISMSQSSRSENRAGELLRGMKERKERALPGDAGGRKRIDGRGVRPSIQPKLSDLGISKSQSSSIAQIRHRDKFEILLPQIGNHFRFGRVRASSYINRMDTLLADVRARALAAQTPPPRLRPPPRGQASINPHARLAATAANLRSETLDPEAREELAECLERIAAGEDAAVVLGVKRAPGQRTLQSRAALAERDRLLREAAERFLGGLSVAAQAECLHKAIVAVLRERMAARAGV